MTKEQLRKILKSSLLLLSARPSGEENIVEFYQREMECGANVLFAPDFREYGANREMLEQVVKTAGENAFTACCIPKTEGGLQLYGGKNTYEEYYRMTLELAKLCKHAGISFLLLGGFSNLTEAKCAVLAAREACDLPLCVGLHFDDGLHLESGIDPSAAVITLQALGVNAVGVLGGDADGALEAVMQMKEFASVPLFALPEISSFMTPESMAEYAVSYVNHKCVLLGTYNGTSGDTAAVSKYIWQAEPFQPDFPEVRAVTGLRGIVFYDFNNHMIGDNKRLLEIAIAKAEEVEPLIKRLIASQTLPVCFNSKDLDALELAVKLYPGRPAVISDEYGEIAAKELGAMILQKQEG